MVDNSFTTMTVNAPAPFTLAINAYNAITIDHTIAIISTVFILV